MQHNATEPIAAFLKMEESILPRIGKRYPDRESRQEPDRMAK